MRFKYIYRVIIILVFIAINYVLLNRPLKAQSSLPADPQYIIMNKTDTGGSPDQTCCFYYAQAPWSVTKEMVDEIRDRVGTDGGKNRKLGIGFVIKYLDSDSGTEEEVIRKILDLAVSENIPISLKLSGNMWWESRSDLWNWWDPNIPGYDPGNVNNVEWTDWNPDSAIKISWRNWGSHMRVRPHPNLGSQVYINEKKKELERLVPIVAEWYENLAEDKKYLLAGLVLDWELGIGVNFFYYPNGNSLLNKDPANDPTYGFSRPEDMVELGYAAVKSYGIKSSGDLTDDDLNMAVQRHIEQLTQTALEAGFPFEKIFAHGGGNFSESNLLTTTYKNMITNYGHPGWSFYQEAYNPSRAPGLSEALDEIDNTPWAAPEWLYIGGNSGTKKQQWKQALENTINYRSNKFLTIYNWEGAVSQNQAALDAIRVVLDTEPACWLTPALISSQVNGDRVTLNWEVPPEAEATYLGVGTAQDRLPSGSLSNINITNSVVTGKTNEVITLPDGVYFWQIVVDGCNPIQRRITHNSFTVQQAPTVPGDINGDGIVDIQDYILLSNYFGTSNQNTDLNNDGIVDIQDYIILSNNFGRTS